MPVLLVLAVSVASACAARQVHLLAIGCQCNSASETCGGGGQAVTTIHGHAVTSGAERVWPQLPASKITILTSLNLHACQLPFLGHAVKPRSFGGMLLKQIHRFAQPCSLIAIVCRHSLPSCKLLAVLGRYLWTMRLVATGGKLPLLSRQFGSQHVECPGNNRREARRRHLHWSGWHQRKCIVHIRERLDSSAKQLDRRRSHWEWF